MQRDVEPPPGDSAPDDSVRVLGATNAEADESVVIDRAQRDGVDRRILGVLAVGLLVLIAGAAALGPRSEPLPKDAVPEADNARPDSQESDPLPEGAAAATGESALLDPAIGAGYAPPDPDHLRSENIAGVFGTSLNTEESSYAIAYVGDDGVTLLDDRGITKPSSELAVEFRHLTRFELFDDGRSAYAIDPENLDVALRVSDRHVVVVMGREDTIGVVLGDEEGPTSVSLLAASLAVPSYALPEGASVIAVQKRGVLVLPRTGGTFELNGLSDDLVYLGPDRAVAASLGATVFERCDQHLRCELYMQLRDSEAEIPLPFQPGDDLFLSPRGTYILADSAAGQMVFAPGSDAEAYRLSGGAIVSAAWSPDEAFVAVSRTEEGRRPELEIVYPEQRTVLLRLSETSPPAALQVVRLD